MKRTLATLTLALAIVVPIGVLTAAVASAQTGGYTNGGGTVVPAGGTVSIPIPGTTAAFTGTGTPGSTITVTQVAAPCPSLGGVGVRINSTGSFNLHLTTGTLYEFNPNTGQCVQVASATAAGLYQVVAGSSGSTGSSVGLPQTGGGAGANTNSSSTLPVAIALVLMVLGGAAVALRRRILQV